MQNVFLQLQLPFQLREGAMMKLANQQKKNKLKELVEAFMQKNCHQQHACSQFIKQFLSQAKIPQVKEKLFSMLVYLTSCLKDANPNIDFVLAFDDTVFTKVKLYMVINQFFPLIQKYWRYGSEKETPQTEPLTNRELTKSLQILLSRRVLPLSCNFSFLFVIIAHRVVLATNLLSLKAPYVVHMVVFSKHLRLQYIVICLQQVGANNADSKEVNALMEALLRQPRLTEQACALLYHPHLPRNANFPFLQMLLTGDYTSALTPSNVPNWGRRVKVAAIPRVFAGLKTISYAQVAHLLQIGEEEVQEYVIAAIKQGILQAKIDQFQQTILVTYIIQCYRNVKLRYMRPEDQAKLQKDISDICVKLQQLVQ